MTPPPSVIKPIYRRSPSYYHRQMRRKAERDASTVSYEVLTPMVSTEQAQEQEDETSSMELNVDKASGDSLLKQPLDTSDEKVKIMEAAEEVDECKIEKSAGVEGDVVDPVCLNENEISMRNQPSGWRTLASNNRVHSNGYPLPQLSFFKL